MFSCCPVEKSTRIATWVWSDLAIYLMINYQELWILFFSWCIVVEVKRSTISLSRPGPAGSGSSHPFALFSSRRNSTGSCSSEMEPTLAWKYASAGAHRNEVQITKVSGTFYNSESSQPAMNFYHRLLDPCPEGPPPPLETVSSWTIIWLEQVRDNPLFLL
jgi:hypothetical protein